MKPIIVKQGDYLQQIAGRMGFDARAVWDDERNKHLKDTNRTPSILHPGDIIYVPTIDPKFQSVSVGHAKEFSTQSAGFANLTLAFLDAAGKPLASTPVAYQGLPDAQKAPTATSGDGSLNLSVPLFLAQFLITFPEKRFAVRVWVGHMDPISQISGLQKRLEHLGYAGSILTRMAQHRRLERSPQSALRMQLTAFQIDHKLAVTGEPDADTVKKLLEEHGC